MAGRRKVSMVRWVASLVLLLPVTVIWAFFLGGHWQSFKVISRSMEPTLLVNDYLLMRGQGDYPSLVNKIVVLADPKGGFLPVVKRVAAGPFSKVRVFNGRVYIDDSEEAYPGAPIYRVPNQQWVLGEDELFVLGDNLQNSEDSIEWGPVKRDDVQGVIFFCYWPIDRIGRVE